MTTSKTSPASSLVMKSLAVFAMVFGLMTLVSGGGVLFGPDTARVQAGSYMPFVVWFNFLAGFVYMLAGVCIWRGKGMAKTLSISLAVASSLIALVFAGYVLTGVEYEMRTVGALVLRTGIWIGIALVLISTTKRQTHA